MSTFYNFLDILKWSLSFLLGSDKTLIECESRIHRQSTDINNVVSKNGQDVWDQEIVYDKAIKEADSFMPLSIILANWIIRRLDRVRKKDSGQLFVKILVKNIQKYRSFLLANISQFGKIIVD